MINGTLPWATSKYSDLLWHGLCGIRSKTSQNSGTSREVTIQKLVAQRIEAPQTSNLFGLKQLLTEIRILTNFISYYTLRTIVSLP
jgi:hypothetical protein